MRLVARDTNRRRRTIWPRWQLRMRLWLRRLPPPLWQGIILVTAVVVASALTLLLGDRIPAPNLALVAVFALSLSARTPLSAWVAGACGFLLDLVIGAPFGVNVLALLFVQTILRDGRSQFRQTGMGALTVFFFSTSFAYAMITWVFGSLGFATALPVRPFLLQAGMTVLAWILLVPLLRRSRLVAT
ncbi:MAG: rod shape-determining protein MreD [Alphaproteobacteria bacterium]|nr:MAG: rod shape-determining protein MreD [Alphaproteobacteria bacterium]